MNIVISGKNERIVYSGVDTLEEYEEFLVLHPKHLEEISIQVSGHEIAKTEDMRIEKRCLVCNEMFIQMDIPYCYADTDSVYTAKAALNKKYGMDAEGR